MHVAGGERAAVVKMDFRLPCESQAGSQRPSPVGDMVAHEGGTTPRRAQQQGGQGRLPGSSRVTRTREVWLPAEERTEQRYSVLSRMASRSQLSTWALSPGSTWVCTGTHVSSLRPFFSQTK